MSRLAHRRGARLRLSALASALLLPLVPAAAEASWTPAETAPFTVNGGLGVDVDPATGDVFVVSGHDNQFRRFDARGTLLQRNGTFGTGPGQFNLASALEVAPDGDVYVTDVGNARVQRWTTTGSYVSSLGDSSVLSNPRGVDVGADGTVYVADAAKGLVRLRPDGSSFTYPTGVARTGFGVALDPSGAVWVTDLDGGGVLRKVDPATGAVLLQVAAPGQPTDVVVGADGQVSVLDFNTSTVRTVDAGTGALLSTYQAPSGAIGMALDQYGQLFTSGGTSVRTNHPDPVAVTPHRGVEGAESIPAAFSSASAQHVGRGIDFDGDGFDHLAPHTWTPISETHYSALGVRLLGLDARSVGTSPFASGPPVAAWQRGFHVGAPAVYSFVFDEPVASFGMFANDVEGAVKVTARLDDGSREFFTMPRQSVSGSTFYGFTASRNAIERLDFDSAFDYHIIDDVQFGRLNQAPEAIDDTASVKQGETVTVPVLANDTDPDGDPLIVASATTDGAGQVTTDGSTVRFTAPSSCGTTETVQYTVADRARATDSARLLVSVLCRDADRNGIDDELETGTPGAFTDAVSGAPTTAGTVGTVPSGLSVQVSDAPDPDGVRIQVAGTGTTDRVTVSVCGGFTLRLSAGSDTVITCGSVRVSVAAGTAELVLSASTTLSVGSGVTAKVGDTGGGTYAVEEVSGGAVTLTTDGTSTKLTGPARIAAWTFVGFTAPVDGLGVLNQVKAGRAVPFKWRLLDQAGVPVTTLASVSVRVSPLACSPTATVDALEEVAAAASTLQNLGNGYYQLNWKSPSTYASSCKTVKLDLGEGITRDAAFTFTK